MEPDFMKLVLVEIKNKDGMYMLQAEAWQSEVESYRISTHILHLEAVERVIQTMQERIQETLSLEDMADIACLSPYYFCRVFHQIVGIPPGEFLATQRLHAAKRLLLTTSLSVTDICFEVGYIGVGSFTTRFTQQVGVAPRLLRHLVNNVGTPPLVLPSEYNSNQLGAAPGACGVSGRIHISEPFRGIIFAGLFPRRIPQGRPVRCTRLIEPGTFHIDQVPDGSYYLLSAAFQASQDPRVYLLPNETVKVGGYGPLLVQNGVASEAVEIELRPLCLTDPPILAALPFLSPRIEQQA
jgi:AraC family transcriptional regulator